MYQGSCLCGAVKYEIHGELSAAAYCHCGRCRKANGSVFAANATVREDAFRLLQGAETLKTYSTSAGVHRVFCGQCGAPVYSKRDSGPGFLRLRLGLLDTPLAQGQGPQRHIFVGSKAGWYEIHDELPQHDERAPA
ncbi:MAG: GFA family protein [Curvibacter sp.]